MIENIRKYTGLMIVVFVILFISFFFLDTGSVRNMGGGEAVLKIAGRTYNDKEFRTLGTASHDLAMSLAQTGDFGLYQFLMALTTGGTGVQDAERFFINRMILREAKDRFGVHPGEEEINDYIRSLRAFSGPDGKFSQENYRNFVERGMGRLGLTERDLRDLASDVLASQKINQIVGAGLGVERDSVAKEFALKNQQITGHLAKLELTPFEEKIEPTEEEIKTYWETLSDSFTTEPRRKFSYVIATPEMPAETADDADAPETIAEAAASDEAKAAAAKAKEEAKAKRAAELAEERRKKQLELDAKVDDFLFDLEEKMGEGFEELAKASGWEIKTTELLPRSQVPAELDADLRSASSGGKAADLLFQMETSDDPFSKISEAIAIGENQWLIAKVEEEEKSRPKTYEEARAEARAQYISEKATEAMTAAANEASTKIATLMAAGKSFAEAAAEAGVTETKPFTAITSTYRPDGADEPQNLFEAARNVEPGTIAPIITESDRAFILHVAKREIVKDPGLAARIDSELEQAINANETIAFTAWISERAEDANVEQLYKR